MLYNQKQKVHTQWTHIQKEKLSLSLRSFKHSSDLENQSLSLSMKPVQTLIKVIMSTISKIKDFTVYDQRIWQNINLNKPGGQKAGKKDLQTVSKKTSFLIL